MAKEQKSGNVGRMTRDEAAQITQDLAAFNRAIIAKAKADGNTCSLIPQDDGQMPLGVDGKGEYLFVGLPFIGQLQGPDCNGFDTDRDGTIDLTYIGYDPETACSVYKWRKGGAE